MCHVLLIIDGEVGFLHLNISEDQFTALMHAVHSHCRDTPSQLDWFASLNANDASGRI